MWMPSRFLAPLLLLAVAASPLRAQIDIDRLLNHVDADLKTRVRQALSNDDPDLAARLIRSSAEAGSAQAQLVLGVILYQWEHQEAQANLWFKKAAAQGTVDAYYALGVQYLEGRGVPEDSARGYDLLFAAARRDQADAQFELGGAEAVGDVLGMPDYPAALYWIARADAVGHPRARELLDLVQGKLSERCQDARLNGSTALIEQSCITWAASEYARTSEPDDCEGAKMVRGSLRERFRVVKGAAEGLTECAYNIGMARYIIGRYHRAHDWLLEAAGGGHASAQAMLGSMYAQGLAHGDSPAQTQARRRFWTGAAAAAGDSDALEDARSLGIDIRSDLYRVTAANLTKLGYWPLPSTLHERRRLRGIPPGPQPADRTVMAGDVILGTWEQFVLVDGEYRLLSRMRVTRQEGRYIMTPLWQARGADVVNALRVHDVQSTGRRWQFVSDWGNGSSGEFRLDRVSERVWEGYVWVAGQRGSRNRWVRVGGG